MNIRDVKRHEMQIRVNQFGIENAADFPNGIGAANFALLSAQIANTELHSGSQVAGFGEVHQQFAVKASSREDLREELSDISRTARSMEYAFNGISRKFRMPQNATNQVLLATARAFATEAVPYKDDFIAYGLDKDFIQHLTDAANDFEAATATTVTATGNQVAATAEQSESINRGMKIVRTLDGIVKNKYRNNVGKLAAWLTATHIEKIPKKKKDTPKP